MSKSCKVAGTLSGIFQIPFCCSDTPTTPGQSQGPRSTDCGRVSCLSSLAGVSPEQQLSLAHNWVTWWMSSLHTEDLGLEDQCGFPPLVSWERCRDSCLTRAEIYNLPIYPVLFCSWDSWDPKGKKNTVRDKHAALQVKMTVSDFSSHFWARTLSTLSFILPPLWSSNPPTVSLMPCKRWLRGWGICSQAWKPKFDPLSPHSRTREPTPANV